MDSNSGLIQQSFNTRYSQCVREALHELPHNFTITDPSISGHPIVFASRGFLKMSGYSQQQVLGQNGKIFQGPKTNRRTLMQISQAIREEKGVEVNLVNLVNYRKDGTPFWMLFHMNPVFDKEDGRVIHFVAVQVPIARKQRSEDGLGFNEIMFGSCRKEVDTKSVLDLGCVLTLDSSTNNGSFSSAAQLSTLDSSTNNGSFSSAAQLSTLDSSTNNGSFSSAAQLSTLDSSTNNGSFSSAAQLSTLDSSTNNVLDIGETCEASDYEKRKAANAFNNILSVLTHYSESTGRLVCGKRCTAPGVGYISSSLNISLGRIKQSFLLIDPHSPGVPIVYASDAFLKLTGYDRHEILGHNFAVLNGADTDTLTLHQIKESMQTEQACTVRILSYRKDESSFWNCLHLSPVRNASGKVAYFVGVQIVEECKNKSRHGLSPEMRQLSTVGAVKVAVRSFSMAAGSSKS